MFVFFIEEIFQTHGPFDETELYSQQNPHTNLHCFKNIKEFKLLQRVHQYSGTISKMLLQAGTSYMTGSSLCQAPGSVSSG